MTDHKLLTYTQASDEYGIPVGTLHSLVYQRRIPVVRFGPRFIRFRRADLDLWIAGHSVDPALGSLR